MRFTKVAALCGLAGPALFTLAWLVGSLRQVGHSPAKVQLSGLAADDAKDPQIMMAGFVALGVCTIVFGVGLGRLIGVRSVAPRLLILGGLATVAAGVFRRDHLLLIGPGFAGESWHNQVHDVVSGIAYAAMVVAPFALGRRFRELPEWASLSRPIQALALASALCLGLFASRAVEPWNGVVQRVAVSLALLAEALVAARMLARPPLR